MANQSSVKMEKWQQLLSVCAGGFLALASGLVSGWFVQRHTRSNSRRELLRSKLEEVCRLSLSLDRWNSDSCAHLVQTVVKTSTPLVSKEIPKCPIEEIALIAKLYFPSVTAELNSLVEVEGTLQKGFYEFSMNEVSNRPVHPVQAFEQMLSTREAEVRSKNEDFRKALEREMKKLLR